MRWILVLAVLVCGCGPSPLEGTQNAIPLDQVPANFMKGAQERLPDVAFDSASKTPEGLYDIRGKTKAGRVQIAEVNGSGEVVLVK